MSQTPDSRPEAIEVQLERLLADAESTATRIRQELAAARDQRTNEADQHAEVDRLQEHLARAQVQWSEVRDFFESALQELLSRREQESNPDHDSETP